MHTAQLALLKMKRKKQIRQEFRNEVFKRDNYICQAPGCGKKGTEETLDAHHITDRTEMPNGGYVKENGITLCKEGCHEKAELFHQTGGEKWEEGMHPLDLYNRIGTHFDIAYYASLKPSERIGE